MEKLTLSELRAKAMKKEWQHAVIVIAEDSFIKKYSLDSRSYEVNSDAKYFNFSKCGSSLFGTSLDKSDCNVRLDWYINVDWLVDYCYILD